MNTGACIISKTAVYTYIIAIISNYVHYTFELITVVIYLVITHPNIKVPKMSTSICINLLLFVIPGLTVNDGLFKSDYNIICYHLCCHVSCVYYQRISLFGL